MRSKELQYNRPKTIALIFDTGDEVIGGIQKFAKENELAASHFSAIGAFSDVTLGYFDVDTKQYHKNVIREQVEVVSLICDIAEGEDGPKVHAHVVVGKRDGSAWGGHLLEAHVRPTLELVLEESPEHLTRKMRSDVGLALIEV